MIQSETPLIIFSNKVKVALDLVVRFQYIGRFSYIKWKDRNVTQDCISSLYWYTKYEAKVVRAYFDLPKKKKKNETVTLGCIDLIRFSCHFTNKNKAKLLGRCPGCQVTAPGCWVLNVPLMVPSPIQKQTGSGCCVCMVLCYKYKIWYLIWGEFSQLAPNVPGIVSRSTMTMTTIKSLLKVSDRIR